MTERGLTAMLSRMLRDAGDITDADVTVVLNDDSIDYRVGNDHFNIAITKKVDRPPAHIAILAHTQIAAHNLGVDLAYDHGGVRYMRNDRITCKDNCVIHIHSVNDAWQDHIRGYTFQEFHSHVELTAEQRADVELTASMTHDGQIFLHP